ncbi:hypothetical protein SESBI_02982 [Sesbania bispinosa]|nr:hypothetical protein SESBI_02982 [Sesbania bispinosa]
MGGMREAGKLQVVQLALSWAAMAWASMGKKRKKSKLCNEVAPDLGDQHGHLTGVAPAAWAT